MDKKRDREQELELPDAKKQKLDNSYLDTSFEIDDAFIEEVDKIERDCASTQRQAVGRMFSLIFSRNYIIHLTLPIRLFGTVHYCCWKTCGN